MIAIFAFSIAMLVSQLTVGQAVGFGPAMEKRSGHEKRPGGSRSLTSLACAVDEPRLPHGPQRLLGLRSQRPSIRTLCATAQSPHVSDRNALPDHLPSRVDQTVCRAPRLQQEVFRGDFASVGE